MFTDGYYNVNSQDSASGTELVLAEKPQTLADTQNQATNQENSKLESGLRAEEIVQFDKENWKPQTEIVVEYDGMPFTSLFFKNGMVELVQKCFPDFSTQLIFPALFHAFWDINEEIDMNDLRAGQKLNVPNFDELNVAVQCVNIIARRSYGD